MKKTLSMILVLVLLIGLLPMNVFAVEATESDANPYKGKVISILGDSISTFAGYIPVADGFNLAHRARYPQSNLLTDVNETWWMQVLTELDAKLGVNDSWAGSRVSNTISGNSGDQGEKAAMASLTRIQNLGSNGTPDVILFYGGTNDIGALITLGTFDSSTAPTEVDLNSTKWNSVADAYAAAILRMQYYYPNAEIVAMLPTYTSSYYTKAELDQYNSVFGAICEHYGVTYVDLRDCGITTANLPDGIHPDAIGMDYITKAVINILQNECDMQAGENVVHSVSHNLSSAESSLGYYKGVTHGKPFIETITGEKLTVTITMGGADITNTAYADGVVTIAEVTGDVFITAKGRLMTIYEDHLQQLPAKVCSCLNLWTSLSPENTYYTGSGWGNISGNAVYSVTIPVAVGDQLWATSFQRSGTNGGGRNGIRITWFDESGVLKSVSPDDVYAEFSANGYVTVPEGAVAVNIPMWKMNDSNTIYIRNRDHCYENGACIACGVYEWDTDGDGVLEILAIGNSFSVDALEYAYQIARDLGIKEIVLGNLYIGGCTLETHAANATGDLGKYTYYFNDNGKWTSTGSYKISTALESRSWDYVSMQQGSPVSGVESTYNKDLTDLITYVQERSDAKLVWHMTWAYQQNSTHSAFPTYGKDQMTMYNAIVSAVQNKIVTNSDFDLIVPNGTAVQNSRTSLLGDTTTRDGYHMSYDYGRYLTGLLFVKTVTGLSVDNIIYAPSGVDAQEKAIAIESVNNAFAKPFEVTQSAYVKVEPEIPDEGYILLQPELHKGAYWYPTDAKNYNTLVTDASNSKYYFATIRFTRETLPVGSIIMIDSGWQYRPDGWVTDTVQTGTREPVTTAPYVVVTEEWWGNYTIRGFNISKVGTPSIMDLSAEDIHKVFRIYVPEERHTHTYTSTVTYPTCTEQGYTTYTCTLCGHSYDDNFVPANGHAWDDGVVTKDPTTTETGIKTYTCGSCGETKEEILPIITAGTIEARTATLSLDELVYVHFYYNFTNSTLSREYLEANGGLVYWFGNEFPGDVNINDASAIVVPGLTYNESNDRYMGSTNGIAMKNLSDTLVISSYVKMPDGTYVYSEIREYSGKKYAESRISKIDKLDAPTEKELAERDVCIALLNAITAAQNFFDHNTENPANGSLSEDRQNVNFSSDMLNPAAAADANKSPARDYDVFTSRTASLNLEGLTEINFYFAIAEDVMATAQASGILFWTEEAYNNAEFLDASNATRDLELEYFESTDRYGAKYPEGFAAKEYETTVYACAYVVDADGNYHYSGVIAYSAETYCNSKINGNAAEAELCKALVVYGEAAKAYFAI